MRGVGGGVCAHEPPASVLVATHGPAAVVYDVEDVGKLPHLVVVAVLRRIPLDRHHVLRVGQPQQGLRGDGRAAVPVGVVDHDADVDRIRDVREVSNVGVLVRAVVVGKIDLQADRPQVMCFFGVFDGVHSVLGLQRLHHDGAAAGRVDHCPQ